MTTYFPPKKNAEFITYISLPDASDSTHMKASPTIAAGDFKVSKDGGAFANLATLPAVTPASGRAVKITLSADEMNADNVFVACVDQTAAAEWCDVVFNLQTTARQIDDLAYPATSGRSLAVDASGIVDANIEKVNAGAITGTGQDGNRWGPA